MIHLRLLGSVELVDGRGMPMVAAMRRQKALAVLAYLASARPRGSHRRDKIAALFWPELSADRARAALRVTLSRLREDVGAEVVVSIPADEIAIDVRHLDCDVLQLEEAAANGDIRGVSDSYRGPFMDGVHVEGTSEELEEWMSLERQRLRETTTRMLLTAARGLVSNGPTPQAIEFARRAVEISPIEEAAHHLLIELLAASGDRGRALEAYAQMERTIARAFGVAPSAELRSLADRLRAESPPANIVPVVARDVPIPRSRGISRAIWIATGCAATVLAMVGASLAREPQPGMAPVAQWSLLSATSGGSRPAGRIEAAAVLDRAGNLVLFGGQFYMTDSSRPMNDLWRLHGIGEGRDPFWIQPRVSGSSPRPRWIFGMASDTLRDHVLVHGGAFGSTSPCGADTWVLDHASTSTPVWRPVSIHGGRIPPSAGFNASFDPAANRLIVFGGHDCISTFFNETWVLAFDDASQSSGSWLELKPDSADGVPSARSSYASAYDAVHHRLFLHGGTANGRPIPGVWSLENADGVSGRPRWRPVVCGNIGPTRSGESAAYDPWTSSLTVFGGMDSTLTYSRDLWRLEGLTGDMGECRWQRIEPGEPSPNARMHASLMIDPRSRALILVGGQFNDNGFSDVWVLRARR
jgi:DNA-binding SARP family transcriptional activator